MSDIVEEKIKLNEISKLDPWTIIETYFRDNPDYKCEHHINSFDEFIHSKTNGIARQDSRTQHQSTKNEQ